MGKWHDLAKEITAIQGSPATPEAMIGVLVGCIEEGLDGIAESLERLRDATDRNTDALRDIHDGVRAALIDNVTEALTADRIVEVIHWNDGDAAKWRIQVEDILGDDQDDSGLTQLFRDKQKIHDLKERVARHRKSNGDPPSEEDGA